MPRTTVHGPPPNVDRIMQGLAEVLRKEGHSGRVAWKCNAAGDYVIAAIVPQAEMTMVTTGRAAPRVEIVIESFWRKVEK